MWYFGIVIVFLLVNMLFFCNLVQDGMFVSHVQEITGTVIHIEESEKVLGTSKYDVGYMVNGTHYRVHFTKLGIGENPNISLGKQMEVSYFGENPNYAKQGSVVKNIGIFILKCSAFILWNMIVIVGWVLHATSLYRNRIFFRKVVFR